MWRCRDRSLPLGDCTLIMGVLNVTPDSFSDGGQYRDPDAAVRRAKAMIAEGADLLDIGGESSRPGAEPVSEDEELARVLPVIEQLIEETETVLSIDTTKPAVAEVALTAGVHIINDISAGGDSGAMLELAARFKAGLVLMHMQGEPGTMQTSPDYRDVVADVRDFLAQRLEAAQHAGVCREAIVLDPGIGFGKTFDHNWALLDRFQELTSLAIPLLVGVSRKRFLGELCNRSVDDRLAASLAAATIAILNGADIIRVHDIKETCDAACVADRIRRKGEGRNRICGHS